MQLINKQIITDFPMTEEPKIGGTDTNTVVNLINELVPDLINTLSPATSIPLIIPATSQATNLSVATDVFIFPVPYDMTLSSIKGFLVTAGTGANVIAGIKINGVEILELTIVAGATTVTVANTTVLSNNDIIAIDVKQIGSTIPGSGLVITLIGQPL